MVRLVNIPLHTFLSLPVRIYRAVYDIPDPVFYTVFCRHRTIPFLLLFPSIIVTQISRQYKKISRWILHLQILFYRAGLTNAAPGL